MRWHLEGLSHHLGREVTAVVAVELLSVDSFLNEQVGEQVETYLVLENAVKLDRRVGRLADLEHDVLVVGSGPLAYGAQVVVGADGALVANATHSFVATVTGDLGVDLGTLTSEAALDGHNIHRSNLFLD